MTKKIYKAYCSELPFIDVPPIAKVYPRAPTVADTQFSIGYPWVYKPTADTSSMYNYGGLDSSGDAIWMIATPGASDVDTLTGDGGGAIVPLLGNITLAGGTNITTAGAVNTITFNLDDAITLATSVTSPIYTSAAGLDINAAAGQNITIQMGDAIGANVIDFEDSASATVASLDSDGTLTVVNMDGIIGATTPAAITGTTLTGNTSVSSIAFTSIGATDTQINAVAGEDIVFQMGDAVGANYVRFQSSAPADVVTIDSTGVMSALAGLTVTGAFEQTGGTFDAGADAAANAVNLGTGAASKVVTIGSVNTTSSLDLLAGTGNFSLEGAVTTTYAISNVGINTGQVDIAGGTGARNINLGLGGTGIKTISIGTSATADVIAIGDGTGAGSLALDAGTGGFSLDATGASNITVTSAGLDLSLEGTGCAINLTSTEGENDAINIEASAANGGILLAAGTGGIRIGDEADCTGLTFGNIAPTASRNITIGSGTVVTAAVTDDISIGDGGATTNANSIKSVDINNGGVTLGEVLTYISSGAVTSGTHTTDIAAGNVAAGTATLNLSTGTGTKIVNLGNADNATTLNINAVTAINTNVNAAFSACVGTSTGTVTLGNIATSTAMSLESSTTIDLDAAGIISINSTAAAINIGNDDIDQAVNVGTDGERTVTVGSVNGAAALVLQSGTTDITLTGTVKEVTSEFTTRSGDYITFQASPTSESNADTGADPTGANTDLNILHFQEGMIMEQYIIGTQTIIVPRMDATGLLSSLDLAAADGWELNYGATRANSRHSYTIGTSAAFFMELRFTLADVSGCEPFYFGFRKTQANQVAFANYTDFVGYGVNNLVAGGDCVIGTRLNTGGINSTDTNDAFGDGTTHTLQVLVSAAGVVTFTFDGGAPTATQAFTFDTGDVVHPFITNLMGAAAPGAIHLQWLKVGYQA